MKLRYKVGLYTIINFALIAAVSMVIAVLFRNARANFESVNLINRLMTEQMEQKERIKQLIEGNDPAKFSQLLRWIKSERSRLVIPDELRQMFANVAVHEDSIIIRKEEILGEYKVLVKEREQLETLSKNIVARTEISGVAADLVRANALASMEGNALQQYYVESYTEEWLRYIDEFLLAVSRGSIGDLLREYKIKALETGAVVRRINTLSELNKQAFTHYDDMLNKAGRSVGRIEREVESDLSEQLVFIRNFSVAALIIYILILMVFSLMLHFYLVDPIHVITDAANKVAEGDFFARANVKVKDELGELAAHFNTMTLKLKSLYENMDDKIKKKTSELEAINQKLKDESEQRMILAKMFESQACTDSMTGCLNRRAAEDALKKEVAGALRHGNGLAICYIDLDNLKVANDLYGHKEGDYMICTFVRKATKCLRKEDVLCRMGGDEFMFICPCCDRKGIESICGRIDVELEKENSTNGKEYEIAYSWGALQFDPERHQTVDKFIDEADQIMYENKARKKSIPA
ncbi:MAG: diguanylate cyclase [Victivallales bacterium]|nr:diguanylate cyclase [Victivallales bacterium]